ncbi:MAG: metallophosphoesterase [Spirochaetota bacterium]|nr:metallophosphoesterase [Spirochaetota bacterium]
MRSIFFFLILGCTLGIHVYVTSSLLKFLPPCVPARIFLIVLAVTVLLFPFAHHFFGEHLPNWLDRTLYNISFSWITLIPYFLIAFFLLDVSRWFRLFPVEKLYANWISVAVIAGVALVILLLGHRQYVHKVRVPLDIACPKISGEPLVIVGMSDLHLGAGIGRAELETWIERIHAEEPDIVLLAGDIIDGDCRALLRDGIAEALAGIHARYGVYAVPGNHEYYVGMEEAEAFLRGAGITLLRDEAALVDNRLCIVGRDDRSNPKRKPLAELIAPYSGKLPIIVLDHQPFDLGSVEENGIDFQFSGHTHGGQIWPINHITDILFECAHGYIRKGDSHIYVSSGIGIWGGKYRIASQSEYLVLRLSGG